MPVVKLTSRAQLAISCHSVSYLSCAKFKFVSKKIEFSLPNKIFILQTHQVINKLINKLTSEEEKIQIVFNYLRENKGRAIILPWVSAEEAWLLPALDCKAFSVLLLELLKNLGIKSELWVGLNACEEEGHAWLEVEINGRKRVLDRDYQQAMSIKEHHLTRPYTLRTKIAYKN